MSKCKYIFLTGGNRGIGLTLVKEILARLKPEILFATYRDKANAEELHELHLKNPNLRLVQMDVKDYSKYDEIVKLVEKETKNEGLNMLFNNAGVTTKFTRLHLVKREQLLDNFETNTVAPILLTKAFLPLLERAAKLNESLQNGIQKSAIINMSTLLASNTENSTGGLYPYRCSKAALNSATVSMSVDLKDQNILAVALHPGWVKTDMGTQKAPLTPSQSCSGIITLLENLNDSHNGKFLQYDSKEIPW